MGWTGPYQLRDQLEGKGGIQEDRLPPESSGLYVVTAGSWTEQPAWADGVLYVGKSIILRARIGDFISSLCGFHGKHAGRHSGGITMNKEYVQKGHNPLDLWIAWMPIPKDQLTVAEIGLIRELRPSYVIRPAVEET
jgi:hypothetical protein